MLRHSLIAMLTASLLFASPVWAQQRIISPADLEAAMTGKVAAEHDQRAFVVSVLQDEQVQALADSLSLDLVRAERAVATLSDEDLAQAVASAEAIQGQLAGEASTVTISLTTLLLILIIVILVAD